MTIPKQTTRICNNQLYAFAVAKLPQILLLI